MMDFASLSPLSTDDSSSIEILESSSSIGLETEISESLNAEAAELLNEEGNFQLLRSFDMVFQLHQRSETIRRTLGCIDRMLLTSRTVAGLVELIGNTLESDLDLAAARILFREDHPMALSFEFDTPKSMGLIPQSLIGNAGLFQSEPYVLDSPSGDLGYSLFGEEAALVASAVVANLCTETEEVGLLCLGSSDPQRYCGGMNMELIASLAEKVSLGLQNAWDHEIRARQSLLGEQEGVYTEAFLKEYLRKEFSRSWRTFRPFSLMALSWGFSYAVGAERPHELTGLIRSHMRGADIVAEGESVDLWVLLPDTDLEGARAAAQRIVALAGDGASTAVRVYAGITSFSREAVTVQKLMSQAKNALAIAMESCDGAVAAQSVTLE